MADNRPFGPEDSPAPTLEKRLTPNLSIRKIIILVNPMSGSVGPNAAEAVKTFIEDYPVDCETVVLEPPTMDEQIRKALEACPDVLFVLAGDGTARTVACAAGPNGPVIAPLPGGTMNMLPQALYGTADWKEALRSALEEGEVRDVSGGRIGDQDFYCAAIFGSPALWAPAREALRTGKLKLAWAYGRRALRRAFTGRLRYALDNADRRKTEALVLISPMISRAMEGKTGLEAAAMDPGDAGQAFRLAASALFGDWRDDISVRTHPARHVRLTSRSRIPAVIDGEPTVLPHECEVTYVEKAFRALAVDHKAAQADPAREDSAH